MLMQSIKSLSTLFLGSASFRLLLSDFFVTFREVLADYAARIGGIAKSIEERAFSVEQELRPNGSQARESGEGQTYKIAEDVVCTPDEVEENVDRVRQRFMFRFEEVWILLSVLIYLIFFSYFIGQA